MICHRHGLKWISCHLRIVVFWIAVFLWLPGEAAGAEAVDIPPGRSPVDLTAGLSYFEDPGGRMDIGDILAADAGTQPEKGRFTPLSGKTGFGYSSATFWFRFTVDNPHTDARDWIVEYPYAAVDHFEFYHPRRTSSGGIAYQPYAGGDARRFSVRPIPYRTMAVPVRLEPGTHRFYFMIRSQGAVVVSLNAWNVKAFDRHKSIDSAINWIYYGVMLTISLFCLLIFFSMKETVFFSLSLFVIGAALFTGVHTGLASQYLWPDHPFWANFFHPLSGFITVTGYLMYSRSFLHTRKNAPRFDTLLRSLTVASVVFAGLSPLVPYRIATQAMVFFTGSVVIIMAVGSLGIASQGIRQAKIYSLTWMPFVVSILLMALKSYGYLENSLLTDSMAQFSSSAVSVLFCFGVMDKINQFRLDREKAIRDLHESEKMHRLLAENVRDIIWILDLKTLNLVYITPSIKTMMGYTPKEATRFTFREMLPPWAAEKAMAAVKEGIRSSEGQPGGFREAFTIELACYHKQGHLFWTETSTTFTRDDNGRPVEMIGVTRDITARKAAEEEKQALESRLHQSGKLEALGTLAGGIAHDMNNIIGAILGYAEVSRYNADKTSRLYHRLDRIINGCYRARDLVGQILAFSRQDNAERQIIRIHLIVKEALKLIRSSLPTTISIDTDIEDKSLMISIDPTQLHRIIMNLCTNAGHAMREKGGVLRVCLDKTVLDDGAAGRHGDLEPGEYVRLTVSDTGAGMETAVLTRIFEPFFTTKPKGSGTGMGLSMVHGIVKNAGGDIFVDSEPGKGTVFRLFFPSVAEIGPTVQSEPQTVRGGAETILYVDDEEYLTDMVKEMLSDFGYTVWTVNSSADALKTLLADPDSVDLLIADQTMPGMTGMALAQKIWESVPGFPVILCSGFSDLISPDEAKDRGVREFVMKPFTGNDLAARIRRVLDDR